MCLVNHIGFKYCYITETEKKYLHIPKSVKVFKMLGLKLVSFVCLCLSAFKRAETIVTHCIKLLPCEMQEPDTGTGQHLCSPSCLFPCLGKQQEAIQGFRSVPVVCDAQ